MTSGVLEVIFAFYIAAVAICTAIDLVGSIIGGEDYPLLTPVTLRESTEMNWVGCVCTWLLFGLVSPIVFIFKLFYFLFHL